MSARTVCLNDTDGDGDCAACARNPEAPCRVSSRERLIRSVYQKLSQNQMERLVDAFAHELAEKQRAKANTFAMLRSEDMRFRAEGLRMGADEIDPAKESDRG